MFSFWTLAGIQVLAVVSGAVTAAVALLIGGLGGQIALARRLTLAEQRVEDTDQRITKEVKRRAGEAGVAARANDPVSLAKAHLELNENPAITSKRPSVVGGKRG